MPATPRKTLRKGLKAWGASKGAESAYLQEVLKILAASHRGILDVVDREHLAELHADALVGRLGHVPPLVRQREPFACGAAAALSVLRRYAPARFAEVVEEDLYAELFTTPELGTEPSAIAELLHQELALDVSVNWPMTMGSLERHIDRDEPVIVAAQAWRESEHTPWSKIWGDGHYLVAVGYDRELLHFMDPSTEGRYGVIPRAEFMERWHDELADGSKVYHLGIVVHGGGVRADAANKPPPAGLGGKLLQKVVSWQKPRVQKAFDFMAKTVDKKATAAAEIYGVHVRHVAGVDSVIEEARNANVDLIAGATEDFLDQVREILSEMEGEPADSIREALEERVEVSKSRGALIARDQTLKLNSQIAQHRQRSAGVTKYTWSGAMDEKERPMHVALEGEVIAWDDPPVTNEDGDRNHPGEDYQCFPGDSEIQLAHGVVKGFRRSYRGFLTQVVTSDGKAIRATPNHPVLTLRGWVALGALKLGDHLLKIAEKGLGSGEHDQHDDVPRIGDVFASLQVDVVTRSRGRERADFHGDVGEGDVDVVLAARPLTFGGLANGKERGNELPLSDAHSSRFSKGAPDHLVMGSTTATNGSVSRRDQVPALGDRHSPHAEDVGLGAATNRHPGLPKATSEHDAFDTQSSGKREKALAGAVRAKDGTQVDGEPVVAGTFRPAVGYHADSPEFLAQVVGAHAHDEGHFIQGLAAPQKFVRVRSIELLPFHGFVFNLETAPGWYAIDGILAHNCRCVPIPFIEELEEGDDQGSDDE